MQPSRALTIMVNDKSFWKLFTKSFDVSSSESRGTLHNKYTNVIVGTIGQNKMLAEQYKIVQAIP